MIPFPDTLFEESTTPSVKESKLWANVNIRFVLLGNCLLEDKGFHVIQAKDDTDTL